MASKKKSLITSLALTALVGICASLAACEVVDDLPGDGDGDMGGETGDGDEGGAGGETSTGGNTATGGKTATGGQGTGGTAATTPDCAYAESCDDDSILTACNAILANFREEIIEFAVPCMNEGGCEESVTSEVCLELAYEEADLTEYETTDYCDPSLTTTCEWDTDEELACDAKIAGIQTAAQEDFEDCLTSEEGMCDPQLCTEILR